MTSTTQPSVIDPNFTHIPPQLTALKQWVLWRLQQDAKGRWTKVPYMANRRRASSTNRATWTSFDAVVKAYQSGGFDGIGFVLTKASGIVGVDMDKISLHRSMPEFRDVFIKLGQSGTYMEVSPSGGGVHAFAFGTLPFDGRNNRELGIEVYAEKRYLTVTGKTLPQAGTEVLSIQSVLDEVIEIAFPIRSSMLFLGECHAA